MNETKPDSSEPEKIVIEEPAPSETPQPQAEPVQVQAEPVQAEKRSLSLMKRLLRALLAVLILLGLGALLVIYAFYIPARRELNDANKRLSELSDKSTSELEAANQKINNLSLLESQNTELQAEADNAHLYNTILNARLDVVNAQFALSEQNPSKARLALTKTTATLQELEKLLPEGQKKVVTDLQSRLKLAIEEIDKNDYAARSDLDVLANALLELQSAVIR